MIHAAFIIVPCGGGKFAATTRPDGRIGLPGGKLEPGESAPQAALREAAEEGWAVTGPTQFHHTALVEGQVVAWLTAPAAKKLVRYKERERGIRPILASGETLAAHGMGNQFLARSDDLNGAW